MMQEAPADSLCASKEGVVITMISLTERLKATRMVMVLILSLLLLMGLSVGSLRAQLKKEEVDLDKVQATVTMKSGDSLWVLAQKYLKDPLKWKYIADLNKIANPNKIRVGTVIYIPKAEAKEIVKGIEEEIAVVKPVVSEAALKLEEARAELEAVKKDYEACSARSAELATALKDKDSAIADLEAKVKSLTGELEAQAELEAELEDMRTAAKSAVDRRNELSDALREKEAKIAEKEARMAELEWKLKQSQTELDKLEGAHKELMGKIEKLEKERKEKPEEVKKPKYVSDPRSRVAAMAIALVGSIIWMASSK